MQQQYYGTLVFCIVSTVISIGIIALFFFVNVQPIKYLLLTIVICLVAIILNAMIAIIIYDQKIASQNNQAANTPIGDAGCPDYFTQRFDAPSNKNFCENAYSTKQGTLIVIGDKFTSINIDKVNQESASLSCANYQKNYDGNLPWQTMNAICQTIV